MTASQRLFGVAAVGLVLFGTTVLVSISVGGWTLWSHLATAPSEGIPPIARPESPPVNGEAAQNTPAPVRESLAAPVETTLNASPTVSIPESVKAVPDRKTAPTGRNHDRQDAMLASVMQRFHNEAYEYFIQQPGMGYGRLKPVVTFVKREWKTPDWTSEELAKAPPPFYGTKDLGLIHSFSIRTFAESNTMTQEERWLGLSKNQLAKKEHLWEIKSLDLVGLAMHDTPVVYVSETLPQMKDLKDTPTRALDLFESEGLEELLSGKALYVRSKEDTIRVLGPIQAGKACLKCHHDSKEGDVLGAFSYTLREGHYVMNGRSSKTGAGLAAPKTPISNPK